MVCLNFFLQVIANGFYKSRITVSSKHCSLQQDSPKVIAVTRRKNVRDDR